MSVCLFVCSPTLPRSFDGSSPNLVGVCRWTSELPLRGWFLKRSTGQRVKGHFFGASDHTLYYMIADDTRLRPHRCKRHTASKSLICLDGYTLLVITKQRTRTVQTSLAGGRSLPPPHSWSTRFVTAWQYALMNAGHWWKANSKVSGSLQAPDAWYAKIIIVFCAHLLIYKDPDHHGNLIGSSFHCPGSLHKMSLQSAYNVLSHVAHSQTDKQTDRQTSKSTLQKA